MPRCFLAAKLKYPYIKWKEGQEEVTTASRTRTVDQQDTTTSLAAWRLGGPAGSLVVKRKEENEDPLGEQELEELEDEEEGQELEELEEQEEEEQELKVEEAWWRRGAVRSEGSTNSMIAPGPLVISF